MQQPVVRFPLGEIGQHQVAGLEVPESRVGVGRAIGISPVLAAVDQLVELLDRVRVALEEGVAPRQVVAPGIRVRIDLERQQVGLDGAAGGRPAGAEVAGLGAESGVQGQPFGEVEGPLRVGLRFGGAPLALVHLGQVD